MIDPGLPLAKIVSGGQTGADRAGLDWAIRHGLPHGGWCPLGRRAEDGPIPAGYQLDEAPSEAYVVRTKWNVRDSDGTVIFTLGADLSGGSKLTWDFTRELRKPCLHLSKATTSGPGLELRRFLEDHFIQVLNVAGPRDSTEKGIRAYVAEVLSDALLD